MRGVYTAEIKISSLNSARTLMYITAPSNKVVEILSVIVTNDSNTTNQQMETYLQKVSSLGTPTGTSLTPSKHEQGDQASGSTVVGNVTASEPTYASNTKLGNQGWASLAGYQFAPVPEERPVIAGGDTWGLRMISTPTSFDATVQITYREIG